MMIPLVLAVMAGAASPAPTAKPLREVVFKASYTRREALQVEHYGAVPPDAFGHSTGDDGTITVDVMAVGRNTLGIRLTESWKQAPRTATYLGNVAPEGTVNFGNQPISGCARDLLVFFGPSVTQSQPMAPGVAWTSKLDAKDVSVSTNYTVAKVDGSIVTINETRTIAVHAARGMDSQLGGWVTYKPSKLVPIAGQLTELRQASSASGNDTIQSIVNFTRLSDTLDH
ncbi:MAG: hypothetical protein KGM44_13765 [bacterium]|nr:hypothetical protein [bacterium]